MGLDFLPNAPRRFDIRVCGSLIEWSQTDFHSVPDVSRRVISFSKIGLHAKRSVGFSRVTSVVQVRPLRTPDIWSTSQLTLADIKQQRVSRGTVSKRAGRNGAQHVANSEKPARGNNHMHDA